MPQKGMRTIFSSNSSSPSPLNSPLHHYQHHTFSDTMMDENMENAELLISKWEENLSDHNNSYCDTISLFSAHRREAKQYLTSIKQLQSAMQYYLHDPSSSHKIIHAQRLMQTAMKRLQKEFYQILKSNRQNLDPESVSTHSSSRASRSSAANSELDFYESEDDSSSRGGDDSVSEVERVSINAMDDLKAIADCMIGAGYAKECAKIYKIIRKSIVDEGLYHLGVERLTLAQMQKMEWEAMELKIKIWLNAVKVAVKTLFYGERILCDHVFTVSRTISESCFAEIAKEGALTLFLFAENVSKCKKSPEKMFRTLDLYEAMSDIWLEIAEIFSYESTSPVRGQAVTSLLRLGEAVRVILTDFESAISKDSSRTAVPGGGVHPVTRYVMNYLTFLSDYSGVLSDIVADWPLAAPSPLPEGFGSPVEDDSMSGVSVRMAWLVLVLLCKLDGKAALYKDDVSLSYLFLANNLQYVVNKVRKSNLRFLLGDDWTAKHASKVRQYAASYERMGWSRVIATLPPQQDSTAEKTAQEATECFRRFNAAFEEVYKKQSSWVVPDSELRDEIKISVARKLVPAYREFYDRYRSAVLSGWKGEGIVRFAPDDLGNYLSDLLHGTGGPGSVSSSSSASSFFRVGRSR